jgi:hypothetical protein
MIQQQLPPLTLLLYWNIGLCSMTALMHQYLTKVWLMEMEMLFMMLNIHAGMNGESTLWISSLQFNSFFFSFVN